MPLHCVHYLPTISLAEGGVTRAVLDICSVMAARGMKITLLAGAAPDAPRGWTENPNVIELGAIGRGGLLSKSAVDRARDALASVNVFHLHAPWLTSNAQLAKIARAQNLPYIITVHGMLDDWSMAQRHWKKRLYLMLAGNRLMRGASRVHCTAQGELMQAKKWIANDKTVVLPLIFDLAPYRTLPGVEPARAKFDAVRRTLDSNRRALLFLSRVHPKKGVELLIEAAAKIDVDVWIAGTGPEDYRRDLEALVARLNMSNRVSFLGLVTGVEKVSLYQAADVFVLPTSQENFGLVLPEALACETPVITTKGVDIWPELQDAGARIVERNADAIAGPIQSLLHDHKQLDAIGHRGRGWVFRELDPDRVAAEYETLYRAVAGTH
jgi:glycosyltransferase involved in cell wall biosynthesis